MSSRKPVDEKSPLRSLRGSERKRLIATFVRLGFPVQLEFRTKPGYHVLVCGVWKMAQTEIDRQKFAQLLLAEFPQLGDDVHEWTGLPHLQMMEFQLITEKAISAGEWTTVERCLRLADTLLHEGDAEIRNAIHVSYLEHLPREGDGHDRIRKVMTPDLRKAWDDVLAYLATLRGNA